MSIFAIASTYAGAAAEAAHGEAASAGLPQLDPTWWPSQLFWLAITFGVLYWLMAGKFLPAIGGAIEERRDRIADDLDQASDFKREAEEAEDAYNQSLADAKAKAQAIAAVSGASTTLALICGRFSRPIAPVCKSIPCVHWLTTSCIKV